LYYEKKNKNETNFVSEYMSYNNSDENKIILEVLFSKLDKKDLVELVNKIKI
jgi:hypothetical protein